MQGDDGHGRHGVRGRRGEAAWPQPWSGTAGSGGAARQRLGLVSRLGRLAGGHREKAAWPSIVSTGPA
ncbi:hypothetical protein E2562_035516 [Oryza meyeriana var. granulata]|uniref:Uncharacterized protein n=1 Tax=Oryza meyeriana var. granulata TaxID=110450 RepID=A0A6G1D9C2_9ORYZ|nr:hypothetical protein E2562_035516 [Oryza meyeriana var. granulata]